MGDVLRYQCPILAKDLSCQKICTVNKARIDKWVQVINQTIGTISCIILIILATQDSACSRGIVLLKFSIVLYGRPGKCIFLPLGFGQIWYTLKQCFSSWIQVIPYCMIWYGQRWPPILQAFHFFITQLNFRNELLLVATSLPRR